MLSQDALKEAADYIEGIEADPIEGMEPIDLIVPEGILGERLDKVLAKLLPEYSRGRIQSWIQAQNVWVNRQVATVRQTVYVGDTVCVHPQLAPQEAAFLPEPIDFEVLFENAQYLVINKQAGLVVHPGSGNWQGTLLNGLLYRYPELARVPRAGIVHRLDKDTSGLMVVARTEQAHTAFVRDLQARTVYREYACCVLGWPAASGRIDAPIGRDPRSPIRMAVVPGAAGKDAVTHFETECIGTWQGRAVAWVRCRLETGRTHQIRVHMQSLGHPLLGDPVYGERSKNADLSRQMLHARKLGLTDPSSGAALHFESTLPQDMQDLFTSVLWNPSA